MVRLFLLVLTATALVSVVSSQIITGKIVSCSGWALNKLPELKSFLKGGEAEQYQGVEVEYVHGRKAVLTIFRDGEQLEEVTLSDYRSKTDMHALMVEKGFVKKSAAEMEEIDARLDVEKQEVWRGREEPREGMNRVQERLKEAQQERLEIEKQRAQQRMEARKRRVPPSREQVEEEL